MTTNCLFTAGCPRTLKILLGGSLLLFATNLASIPASAQFPPMSPPQLDQLVARIALYPDPLLAQVLTASTYWAQIPEAAQWATQHSYMKGEQLAQGMQEDHLQWDASVLALLPFPSVLQMMAGDPVWLEQLGNAVLTQRGDVMDAVQRMRQKAKGFGYLQSNSYMNVVADGGYIEILPANPELIYVPTYDPLMVFARPARGLAIGGAITFGPGITIGGFFAPFGWAHPLLRWPSHSIVIDRPWERVWANREAYVHPYARPWVRPAGPRVEAHKRR